MADEAPPVQEQLPAKLVAVWALVNRDEVIAAQLAADRLAGAILDILPKDTVEERTAAAAVYTAAEITNRPDLGPDCRGRIATLAMDMTGAVVIIEMPPSIDGVMGTIALGRTFNQILSEPRQDSDVALLDEDY